MLRCILATRFELCIDKGYEVRELTSGDKDWEAGTTIVMRIVFEEFSRAATLYKCRICGCEKYLETGAIDDTAGIMAPIGVSTEWLVRPTYIRYYAYGFVVKDAKHAIRCSEQWRLILGSLGLV